MVFFLGILFFCIFEANSFFIDKESTINVGATQEPFLKESSKFYDGDYDYGYVEVREGAFMFWWLYYAGGKESTAYQHPFVIWMQGGPGVGGSGTGNFMMIGPQDMQFQNRNHSWVKNKNVLFIDSPVGSGFSYVKNDSLLVETDENIANDLVELMKQFLEKFPKFKVVPTHIFSESYAGKVAPIFAYYLHKEIQNGTMTMNLRTVGLGSSAVSSKHFLPAHTEYLYYMGFLDQTQYASLKNQTRKMMKALDTEQYPEANRIRLKMLKSHEHPVTRGVNIYNVLQEGSIEFWAKFVERLERFMNLEVKTALTKLNPANVPAWKYAGISVHLKMLNNVLRPSMNFVEKLLNETNINLVVYNGQLDSVTPLSGAIEWVHSLEWSGADEFKKASLHKIRGSGNGYYKYHDKLSFWWVYKAGHMIPSDNPEAMEHILNLMVDSVDSINENDVNL